LGLSSQYLWIDIFRRPPRLWLPRLFVRRVCRCGSERRRSWCCCSGPARRGWGSRRRSRRPRPAAAWLGVLDRVVAELEQVVSRASHGDLGREHALPPEHVNKAENADIKPTRIGSGSGNGGTPPVPSSARALVAKVDDAGAEGLGLGQPQVEGFGERREVRGAGAEDDRVDELAVFVDQVLGDGGRSWRNAAQARRGTRGTGVWWRSCAARPADRHPDRRASARSAAGGR
jgi:hypothetical protein